MIKDVEYYMHLPYKVTVKKIKKEEGGGYRAFIPLLGEFRCCGWGKYPQEASADLEEVMRDMFEDYLKKRYKILEPKRRKSGGKSSYC